MNRLCPKCKQKAVSVYALMIIRPRCSSCRSKVGHHWLYDAVFWGLQSVMSLFFLLYLISKMVPLFVGVAVYFSVIGSMVFLWASKGPLESKREFWEP